MTSLFTSSIFVENITVCDLRRELFQEVGFENNKEANETAAIGQCFYENEVIRVHEQPHKKLRPKPLQRVTFQLQGSNKSPRKT
jgi:hypothetical protein